MGPALQAPENDCAGPWKHSLGTAAVLSFVALAVFLWAKGQVLPGWHAPMTFDGMYYQSIFDPGYDFTGDIEKKGNTAFLPLMAVLIGLASALPGSNAYLEVVMLGTGVLFATLVGIHRLASHLANGLAGTVASAFWAFSPMAFYNFVGYSEPVFALLTVWTLLALRRGNMWQAALMAGLAVTGRPVGMVLVIWVFACIAWEYRERPVRLFTGPAIGQMALALLPIMAFATWAAVHFGDSVVYINSTEAWRRGSVLDGNVSALPALGYYFDMVANDAQTITPWIAMLTTLSLGVIAWTLMLARRDTAWLSLLYVLLLAFTFHTSSLDVMNIARRSLFMVPWVVLVGVGIAKERPVHWATWLGALVWLVFATLVQISSVSRYYRGEWVS